MGSYIRHVGARMCQFKVLPGHRCAVKLDVNRTAAPAAISTSFPRSITFSRLGIAASKELKILLMDPAQRTRDIAWPLCVRKHQYLVRMAKIHPRSVKCSKSQSTDAMEPGLLQQLEIVKDAVGGLSRDLGKSSEENGTCISPTTSKADVAPSDEHLIRSEQSLPFRLGSKHGILSHSELPLQHIGALWEHYLNKVDPLVRIIDTSTVQHLFISVTSVGDQPKDVQSLKSAILFAAASSMQRPYGSTCSISDALMKTHSKEVEDSLAASQFLTQPSMAALQALTIYLTCGRRFLDSTFTWSMTAVLVRLATALRLHRDPEAQGLPFSDCESRRRLWWHICTLDSQTSRANHTDPLIHERQCNTRVPEWSTDPACPEYLKNMFFSVVCSEITYYERTILFSDQFTFDNGYPILAKEGKLCIIEALEETLQEKFFGRCDKTFPTMRLAITWSKITIARLKLAVLYTKDEIVSCTTDSVNQILRSCVEVMEGLRSARADPSLSMWAWFWQSYADWDAAKICLIVLNETNNASAEMLSRAGCATGSFFDSWAECLFDSSRQEQWKLLNQLRAQADLSSPFTKASERKNTRALIEAKAHSIQEIQIREPPISNLSRRSFTTPVESLSHSSCNIKRHRKTLHAGNRASRNWSLPIYPKVDEMHFDIKALDLQDIKNGR